MIEKGGVSSSRPSRRRPVLALGNVVADELYERSAPIVVLAGEDFFTVKQPDFITVTPDGKVAIKMVSGGAGGDTWCPADQIRTGRRDKH